MLRVAFVIVEKLTVQLTLEISISDILFKVTVSFIVLFNCFSSCSAQF